MRPVGSLGKLIRVQAHLRLLRLCGFGLNVAVLVFNLGSAITHRSWISVALLPLNLWGVWLSLKSRNRGAA